MVWLNFSIANAQNKLASLAKNIFTTFRSIKLGKKQTVLEKIDQK